MIEKETIAPAERPLVAAVIYNRLHARMPLGIDATLRYGLHIPPTKSILQSQLDSDSPYNSRKLASLPPTPIANPGLASIRRRASREGELPLLRAQTGQGAPLFHASDTAFAQYECAHGYGCDDTSRAPRAPGCPFALAAHAERGVRRTGLDWDYTAHDVADALEGVASLRNLGFAGANVTIPHKQAVVAACDEAEGDAVNAALS